MPTWSGRAGGVCNLDGDIYGCGCVGVPEMTPVLVAIVNPVGRVPEVMDQLYGVAPPVAVRVAL